MRVCTVTWTGEEAKVTFNEEFLESDWLIKADALVDVKYEVEKLYEQVMKGRRYE
jgi:hypothetical protein